jgi:hydrogenase expression/formation protein HypC
MCLAIPARVIELRGAEQAMVELGGVRRLISRELIDQVQIGDYLIVHVGYALSKLDEAEARKTLELLAQGGILESLTPDPSPAGGRGEERLPCPEPVAEGLQRQSPSPAARHRGNGQDSPLPLAGEGPGVRV